MRTLRGARLYASIAAVMSGLALLAACGAADRITPPPLRPTAVVAVGSTTFAGRAGEPVTATVEVTTSANEPMPGVEVRFEITAGGGSVSPSVATTDAVGRAVSSWTFALGENTLAASVDELLPVVFTANGSSGPPVRLHVREAPADARVGASFGTQPIVEVQDALGNRVAEAAPVVAVDLVSGSGALAGTTVVQASAGLATFIDLAMTGAAGSRTIRFSAPGLEHTTSTFALLPPARSVADRPDDVEGPQVHVLYVLPSDGGDRALDTDVTLAFSVASFQAWLASQTGGLAFLMDTYEGALDVTFFQLDRTEAQMRSLDPFVVSEIERQLMVAGRIRSDKLYLVYYDGGSTYACGGAAWPPDVPGRVAAMYLHGTPGGASCGAQMFATSPTAAPGYWEFAALHDLIHTVGVVSRNAPNHTATYPAHVPEPADLMYGGTEPWQIGSLSLDVSGRDYFGHDVPEEVVNLELSPFLAFLPDVSFDVLAVPNAFPKADAVRLLSRLPPHPTFHHASDR